MTTISKSRLKNKWLDEIWKKSPKKTILAAIWILNSLQEEKQIFSQSKKTQSPKTKSQENQQYQPLTNYPHSSKTRITQGKNISISQWTNNPNISIWSHLPKWSQPIFRITSLLETNRMGFLGPNSLIWIIKIIVTILIHRKCNLITIISPKK